MERASHRPRCRRRCANSWAARSRRRCSAPVNATGTAAVRASPEGITTDGTNLYVTENTAVRKVVISTGAVTTLAGSTNVNVGHVDGIGTAARFNNLEGITTDGTNL